MNKTLFDYMQKPLIWSMNNQKRPLVAIQSSSRGSLLHWVELKKSGWDCDCEDWKHRQPEPCKHILRVKNAILTGKLEDKDGVAFTSRVAYLELIESGVWGKDCKEVLEIITKYPDMCDREIQRTWINKLKKAKSPVMKGINAINGRRNDLVNMGLVHQSGTKKNRKTNKIVRTWRAVFET